MLMKKEPRNILNISSLRRKFTELIDCGSVPSKSKITFSPSRHMVQAIL